MNTQPYCWSCNHPGGEMLRFGSIHIHNTPSCREAAGLPKEKHDGILDARSQYFRCVLLTSEGDRQVVIMDDTFDGFGIAPRQALSLRDWLIQESPELERLAKAQEP